LDKLKESYAEISKWTIKKESVDKEINTFKEMKVKEM